MHQAWTVLGAVLALATPASSSPLAERPTGSTRLEITVDPRIELVSAVSLLAGDRPGWTPREDSPYRARLKAFVEPHRSHPAVALMREMKEFAYSNPAEAIIHFGTPPDLEPIAPVPAHVLESIGGQAALDGWLDALRRFARASDFMTFFASQQGEFERMVARTRETIGDLDVPGAFEAFYGVELGRCTLVLAPNLLPGAFGPSVAMPDGTRHYYSIQGSAGVVDGVPVFGNRAAIASLAWHEIGHSVVNRLTEAHRSELAASEPVYGSMRREMQQAAYPSWPIALNELLVRAAAMRISARNLKGDEALRAIATQHAASPLATVYVYRCADLLQTFYEPGRGRWKDYPAFYPVNLLLLNSIAEEIASP